MPPSPAPHTCWCYLIRHGATIHNLARPVRLQGRGTDAELSEIGLQQAQQTGRWLADHPIAAVYASPLLRAKQTAEAVAEPHRLAVNLVDDLVEVDVGQWEGRCWDEIEQNDPEGYRRFMEDAGINPYQGGENLVMVQQRVAPVLDRLMAENLGRSIAVVAHNVVNRAYVARLLEINLRHYRKIPQDNCGVNLLRYRNGEVKLITVNALEHLNGLG